NLFLRVRISAKTSAAGLPAMPMPEATSGTSARRNGLASFSSPSVTGIVGSLFAICCFACVSRAASALLFGWLVSANLIFAVVHFNSCGEFDIRCCVFMPAIELGIVWEVAQFHQRAPHLFRCPFDHTAAPDGKQRVADEGELVGVKPISNMAKRMTRRFDDAG